MKIEISVDIQWPCPHCSHVHQQRVKVSILKSSKHRAEPPAACPLTCAACGRETPLYISLANLPGLAIKTPASETHPVPNSGRDGGFWERWRSSARNPSAN
jgi:hypothetical protein